MQLRRNSLILGLVATLLFSIAIIFLMGFGNFLGTMLWGPI
ncbi:MAG: hypothetical protein ACJ0SL_08640 [Candidatus Rariloculaceae bacterium]